MHTFILVDYESNIKKTGHTKAGSF